MAIRLRNAGVYAVPGLRSQTRETRYRLPDVCMLLSPPKTDHLVDAAFAAIEILSKDDKMTEVMEKLEEYDRKGVPNIWVIDPRRKKISVYANGDLREVQADVIATSSDPRLELTRAEIFQE